jgi:hypothetical protein
MRSAATAATDVLPQQTDTLMSSVLGETEPGALVEVALYFRESFGNQTRIDYGSGERLMAGCVS